MDGLGVLIGILLLCWLRPGKCAAAGAPVPVYRETADALNRLENYCGRSRR